MEIVAWCLIGVVVLALVVEVIYFYIRDMRSDK